MGWECCFCLERSFSGRISTVLSDVLVANAKPSDSKRLCSVKSGLARVGVSVLIAFSWLEEAISAVAFITLKLLDNVLDCKRAQEHLKTRIKEVHATSLACFFELFAPKKT